jgi:hypothetical protein
MNWTKEDQAAQTERTQMLRHRRDMFYNQEERAMRKLFRSLPAETQAKLTADEAEPHDCKLCQHMAAKESN